MNWKLVVILALLFVVPVKSANSIPIIDAKIDEVWSTADHYQIDMQNQVTVDFRILTGTSRIYFLAIIPHDGPNDVINLDTTQPHDYFGIEFDRNGDKVIHGTDDSPDDMVLVNYFQSGSQDFLTKSFNVINDTAVGGTEDTEGAQSSDGSNLIFEFSVKMASGDSLGADISVQPSETISIMLAFWDDRPTHDANVIVNKAIAGSVFLDFKLSPNSIENLLAGGLSIVAIIVTFLIVRRKIFTRKVRDKQIS